jgi:hypothetical protein
MALLLDVLYVARRCPQELVKGLLVQAHLDRRRREQVAWIATQRQTSRTRIGKVLEQPCR